MIARMSGSGHLFERLRHKVLAALEALCKAGELPPTDVSGVGVDVPKAQGHGDVATNAALMLAKPAGKPPLEIAEMIAREMRKDGSFEKVEVARPGFVNFTLKPESVVAELAEVLRTGGNYGKNTSGSGKKVNVEYVSANPTGPLHIGHVRGAVFGDVLANLLEWSGFDVCREYYINDAGLQVDVLARSAFLRYREALGEDIGAIPEDMYPGEYLCAVGKALAQEHGKSLLEKDESEWLPSVRETAVASMLKMIKEDLRELGIVQEYFASEREVLERGGVEQVLERLNEKGLLYEGVLEPPKGKEVSDWKPREQTLFRSTAFGDDTDRALKKADGSPTYFVNDIAYHFDKFERGFSEMIDVWGADHGGYIKRQQAAVKAMTDGKGYLDIKVCQLVRLLRGGEVVKMSKRAGTFVTLRELVKEAGRDATRFMMLHRKNDAVLDFDFAKVVEQSKDNPVFYVQYAHARACSVLRAADEMPELHNKDAARDFAKLRHSKELDVIKQMAAFPHVVENAARAHEPHRIAFYLYELASVFHTLWTEGKRNPSLRFLNSEDCETTLDRVGLIRGVSQILSNGLSILGVEAPEEMR